MPPLSPVTRVNGVTTALVAPTGGTFSWYCFFDQPGGIHAQSNVRRFQRHGNELPNLGQK